MQATSHTAPAATLAACRVRRLLLLGAVLVALPTMLVTVKGSGLKARVSSAFAPAPAPTRVAFVLTLPADAAVNVPVNANLLTRIRVGRELDESSVTPDNVYLVRVHDQRTVPATISLEGPQAIRVRPQQPLDPATIYALYVSHGVKTTDTLPVLDHMMSFTTAAAKESEFAFTKIELPTTAGTQYTCVNFGPDGHLWASTIDGRIQRFAVNADGTLESPETFGALQAAEHGPRLLTGFCFDRSSSEVALILSHSIMMFENSTDFTGKISRLSGPGLTKVDDLVVNLPRSSGDHATNQPSFGPDGAIYFPQPSNSAMGRADATWGMRSEHRLSATILRLDLSKLTPGVPLDVRTVDAGGTYDPFAANAPLTVYADGIRLAFDLLWHSNGNLYAAVNGSSAGGNTPRDPSQPGTQINNLTTTENDWLFHIQQGRYYGHPNPTAGHYILNGGHPTAGMSQQQAPEYPIGTRPDSQWTPALRVIGQHVSSNGMIEYAGPGELKGRMMICRYNRGSDILILSLDAHGNITHEETAVPGLSQLRNPLDLTQNPATGDIYISEFGAKCITLARPAK